MSDFYWPVQIKPLINKNYSTSRGSNVLSTPLTGGVPIVGLDTTLESPPFSLNFILDNLRYQVLLNFYDVVLNHGANSFLMNLDSGNGIEEHRCFIVPNTWKVSRPSDGNWYLAVSVVAKVTSSQLETSTSLYDLFTIYGDDVKLVLDGFGKWVESMPND